MAEYIGLKAIAERMGWKSPKTPINQMVQNAFPLFRKWHGFKHVWVTDDDLILIWKSKLCVIYREEFIRKREERLRKKAEFQQKRGKELLPGK